jgi:hypothetical protein
VKSVKVQKDELQKRVKENRDSHRSVYEQALDGYHKAVVEWLEVQLDRAKAGKAFDLYFNQPMPEDHTADYDNVLDMLDMSTEDEIELSNQEFRQYVRDEWGWKHAFTETASNYLLQT